MLIAVTFGWLLQQRLVSDAVSQQAHEGAAVVDSLLWSQLSSREMNAPVSGPEFATLDRLVRNIKKSEGHIVRVKLWNRAGEVFFSDDKRIVGRNFAIDSGLRAALAGRTSAGISDLTDPENIDERRFGSQLLQTYVPIHGHGASRNKIIGVYEIYHDLTALNPRIASIRQFVVLGVGGGFLFLFLTMFFVVRGASRQLERQTAENEAKNQRIMAQTAEVTVLKEVDRLKDEFISVISHELRRPLSSIKGYAATLLLTDDWDESTRHDLLQVIEDESDQLSELVQDLLDLSRLGAGMLTLDRQPVLIPQIVRDACARIDTQPDVNAHQFIFDFPDNFPAIDADPQRLSQVMVNLVENAAKYSASGTSIYISGRLINSAGRYNAARDSKGRPVETMIEVSVRDEGIGLSDIERERVFDRFYRVDNSLSRQTQGSGLGLAIARGVVEAHGGDIWAAATDRGAEIVFRLPVAPSAIEGDHEPEALERGAMAK